MAVVTTTFTSLSALVEALDGAPDYLDLSAWRGACDDILDALESGSFSVTEAGPNHVAGTVGGGTFEMDGVNVNFGSGPVAVITALQYDLAGGAMLQLLASVAPQVNVNANTDTIAGNFSQVLLVDGAYSIGITGSGPAAGTGSIKATDIVINNTGFALHLNSTAGITISNTPGPTFLKPTAGTINSITLTIGEDTLTATGLALSAVTFFNADQPPELEAVVNLIFSGNSTLEATGDGQTLLGGSGNNTFDFGIFQPGTASELANGGTDLVKVQQDYALDANIENATVTGPGGVLLTGNLLANKLTGGAGNDTLDGGAGKDTLAGGGGDDKYFVDLVNATPATLGLQDSLAAEALNAGSDTVWLRADGGVAQNTTVFTFLLGANLENLTFTETALPLLINATGNLLNNAIVGNNAANLIKGEGGNDTLAGANGNDTLDGGLGNDNYTGGDGADRFLVAQAGDFILDSMNGQGNDTVLLGLATGTIYNDIAVLSSIGNVVFTGTGAVTLAGNAFDNALTGGAGNDVLNGAAGNDTLDGKGGNDTYHVDSLADTLADSAGIDTVISTVAGWTLGTGFENLVMNADGLGTGNAANNVLTDGEGVVTLRGGLGNDTYNITNDDLADETTGGGGTKDLVVIALPNAPMSYTLADGVENLALAAGESGVIGIGNALGNLMTASGSGVSMSGGEGNDTLVGGAGFDTLEGGAGKDSMAGGLGDDTYIANLFNPAATTLGLQDAFAEAVNAGTDTVRLVGEGLTPNTTPLALTLGANLEALDLAQVDADLKVNATGNALNNTMTGSDGANKLDGGAGNDSLDGGDGGDTLLGGAGNDTLAGGGGVNSNSLDGGLGNDLYLDGAGTDTFVIAQAGDTIAAGAADFDNDTLLVSVLHPLLDLSGGHDNLSNVTYTGAAAATIAGNGGVNLLKGGAGNDTLLGNGSNDILHGNGGNDSLDGGTGNDQMLGGLGNDTYRVDAAGDQVIELAAGGTGDTVVSDVTLLLLNTAAFDFIENVILGTGTEVRGNGLANRITGNANANTLEGGAGNDTFTGGDGGDYFVISFVQTGNAETVLDFDRTEGDRIALLQVAGGGPSSPDFDFTTFFAADVFIEGKLESNAAGNATAANQLVYKESTGQLFYDANGVTAGGQFLVMTFDIANRPLELTGADFVALYTS